ncbi:hypothetical protein D9619_001075 [Psilocybe cf. subviscida]|uniref:HpcH/HpaI aldolase/citrate lyase domain-containing protein n=1 Tax=Psilocybe cf. subviscida TaxID=2480587 RepID=A0A8H5BFY2_9AGAR|nr:hypothetical protein D9619_001075 [Psilocybe cf. subviscida]
MDRFTRFIPTFASGAPSLLVPSTDHGQTHSDNEGLLGLQRTLRDAQDPRRPVLGSWMMLPGAALARMTAQMGYDFVLVDCEHGNIDDGAMHAAVGAVAAEGASPVVRIPGPDNVYVKRALDSGAHGILCPSMSTAEEARKLVSFAKFPAPKKAVPTTEGGTETPSRHEGQRLSGTRGVGSPIAPAVFRQTLREYIRTANQNTLIAVQIETLEGLENCEDIARVDGIDMLFIGPNDLASAMGYPALEHESIPEVQAAVQRVLDAAKNAGKYAGMFCTASDQVRRRFEQGFDLMNLGGDIVALMEWNAVQLEALNDIRHGRSRS